MVTWTRKGEATCKACGIVKRLGSELAAAYWGTGHVGAAH